MQMNPKSEMLNFRRYMKTLLPTNFEFQNINNQK